MFPAAFESAQEQLQRRRFFRRSAFKNTGGPRPKAPSAGYGGFGQRHVHRWR
jgi:hypothetical protein